MQFVAYSVGEAKQTVVNIWYVTDSEGLIMIAKMCENHSAICGLNVGETQKTLVNVWYDM